MPIFFTDLADDAGWEAIHVDQADPSYYWNDGGPFTAAPVDAEKTFTGAMWASSRIEPAFNWRGRRIRPDFTVPTRHHNLPQLIIVVSGELVVEDAGRAGRGGFFTVEAGTPYTMTAGPDGAVYTECWDVSMSLVETVWHDGPHWVHR